MTHVSKLDDLETFDNTELVLPKTLPNLKGSWYVLVFPIALTPAIKDSGTGFTIELPEDVAETHGNMITAGVVVKMGELAYRHNKFKNPETGEFVPWCAPGDYAVFSRASYSQTIIHGGKKFYLLPDESLLYTVDDIRDINPYYVYDEQVLNDLQKQIFQVNSER
jgi:hypothetical protein